MHAEASYKPENTVLYTDQALMRCAVWQLLYISIIVIISTIKNPIEIHINKPWHSIYSLEKIQNCCRSLKGLIFMGVFINFFDITGIFSFSSYRWTLFLQVDERTLWQLQGLKKKFEHSKTVIKLTKKQSIQSLLISPPFLISWQNLIGWNAYRPSS